MDDITALRSADSNRTLPSIQFHASSRDATKYPYSRELPPNPEGSSSARRQAEQYRRKHSYPTYAQLRRTKPEQDALSVVHPKHHQRNMQLWVEEITKTEYRILLTYPDCRSMEFPFMPNDTVSFVQRISNLPFADGAQFTVQKVFWTAGGKSAAIHVQRKF